MFTGEIIFDDTGVDLAGDFTVDLLEISFPPFPFTIADENVPSTASFVGGELSALNFFVDPGAEEMFESGGIVGPLAFRYLDFMVILDDDGNFVDQEILSRVSGEISGTPFTTAPEVPLPGAAVLFLSAILGGDVALRRKKA